MAGKKYLCSANFNQPQVLPEKQILDATYKQSSAFKLFPHFNS